MRSSIRYHGFHGVMLFLFLIASAMMQIFSFVVLLPLLVLAAVLALSVPDYDTGYLSVALTICKNE